MNGAISRRKALILAAVIPVGIAAIVAAVLLAAPAAQAATATVASQPVQFSADGTHWSDSYTGALFGGVLLVPGGSADRAFYVRNGASEPAVLRVTLFDVAATDTDLATAMTVSTSLPARPGAPVPVTAARPCATLSEGQVLAAGEGIRLDNVATLADLAGTSGQTRDVSFKLAISLRGTDSAAPAPDSCPTDFGSGTGDGTGSGTGDGTVVGAPSAVTPAAPTTPEHPESPAVRRLVADTQRLFQENFVALWLAMTVLGVLLLLVRRGRRSDEDSAFEPHVSSQQPTSQNGTGR